MSMFRILAAAAALATASGLIKDCDTTSVFRPTELAVTPDPPVAGQPVAMTVKFDNPGAEVTDGTVTTYVTLNYIPFQPSEEPLCQNTACPIPTGAVDRSTSSTWPDKVNGRIVTKSVWTGSAGETLLCVQTSFAVGAQSNLRGALNLTDEFNATIADLWRDDLSAKAVAEWHGSLRPEELEYRNDTCPAVDLLFY